MRALASFLPTGRALVALDAVLLLWVVGWIALGVAVGVQVDGLRKVSRPVQEVGAAVQETGSIMSNLSSVPLVGIAAGAAGRQIEDAGASAEASAQAAGHGAAQLSWMLALAIALIPCTPVLALYLPVRAVGDRERRALRRLWMTHGHEPEFRRLLASRALTEVPYARLWQAAGEDPWAAYSDGRHGALVEAELRRWGIEAASAGPPPRA